MVKVNHEFTRKTNCHHVGIIEKRQTRNKEESSTHLDDLEKRKCRSWALIWDWG